MPARSKGDPEKKKATYGSLWGRASQPRALGDVGLWGVGSIAGSGRRDATHGA